MRTSLRAGLFRLNSLHIKLLLKTSLSARLFVAAVTCADRSRHPPTAPNRLRAALRFWNSWELTPLGGLCDIRTARQNPPRQRVPRPLSRPASRADGRSPTAIHKGNSSHNASSSDRPTARWQAAQRLAERAILSIWGGSGLCRRRWFAAVDV